MRQVKIQEFVPVFQAGWHLLLGDDDRAIKMILENVKCTISLTVASRYCTFDILEKGSISVTKMDDVIKRLFDHAFKEIPKLLILDLHRFEYDKIIRQYGKLIYNSVSSNTMIIVCDKGTEVYNGRLVSTRRAFPPQLRINFRTVCFCSHIRNYNVLQDWYSQYICGFPHLICNDFIDLMKELDHDKQLVVDHQRSKLCFI